MNQDFGYLKGDVIIYYICTIMIIISLLVVTGKCLLYIKGVNETKTEDKNSKIIIFKRIVILIFLLF